MPRPKCEDKTASFRQPPELHHDNLRAAGMLGVTESEYVKNALEFKHKLAWVIQADWYKLRLIDPVTLQGIGPTLSDTALSVGGNHVNL